MVIYIVNGYLNSEFFAKTVEISLYQQLVLYRGPVNTSVFKMFGKSDWEHSFRDTTRLVSSSLTRRS